ncbi:YrzI family small protein [Evansella tamaricis]|uniref:YrzI family small protein n=1 Tax=Evansella tamaricis TaxID=2069301 RepID=A0ABS6JJM3_9BACI|nr:YrzI family small protein [Evansella tamaricis]MBU9713017.1 YrzI family small protein [Evansella tamaricis]
MMFHIFFITVNITKRKFTEKEIMNGQLRKYSNDVRNDMQVKQAQYTRLI